MTDLSSTAFGLHPGLARELGERLRALPYTTSSIGSYLGPNAYQALYRGEVGAVLRRCHSEDVIGSAISTLLLRRPTSQNELEALFGSSLAEKLISAGVFHQTKEQRYEVAYDIRPHLLSQQHHLIVADLDASTSAIVPGKDHVLGVGAASKSLLHAIPQSPTGTVLDLGTGSGVLSVAQSGLADQIVGTDIHHRAIELAQATLEMNGITSVQLREGSWFEPVAGEQFDRIVANPPFVVGIPEVGHVYRDSGMPLDEASRLVAEHAPEYLAEGGMLCMLGSWAHIDGEAWQSRVASWVPSQGVSAWVLQREVVDPETYVATWLKDESVDLRTESGIARTQQWLDYFQAAGVHAIGFGWIFMQHIGDQPSEITAEELTHPFTDPLGPEVEEYYLRQAWLRQKSVQELLDSSFLVRPTVAIEDIAVPNTEEGLGFTREELRITRMDGPRFSHSLDEALKTVLAGLHPAGLPLRDVVGILAASRGVDDQQALEELENQTVAAVVDLIRHGIVLPSEIAEVE
ncbi:methyltransferase [Corynebacterium sp. CCUG 61414]|uniref:DUF7782 domain-containing protein n=1 Tax=unclassified Corynebacterium TaxID=2624378 RepID=UPI00210A06A1|nr:MULTISPECIES: methyltransferase [unclassified Corynebacterium]MCQ4609061.1 methyltransferase [Corynebacterium sp. CCUG 61414]WPJ93068.1 methyltransferase [Corynebacterium sp. UMB2355A]